jgi:hypothetical protein
MAKQMQELNTVVFLFAKRIRRNGYFKPPANIAATLPTIHEGVNQN